jgi:hypothetical protein
MNDNADVIPGFVNAAGEVYTADIPVVPIEVEDNKLWVERLRRKLQCPGRPWKGGGGTTGVLKELRDHGEDVEEMCAAQRQLLQGPYGGMDASTHAAYVRWVLVKHRWIRSEIHAKLAEIERRSS